MNPNPYDSKVFPATRNCSFVINCVNKIDEIKKKIKESTFLRDNLKKSQKGRSDTTRDRINKNRNKITDSLKPEWLLDPKEYLEEIIKDGTCSTMNACQCLGIAPGGCPGKPGWTPEDLFKKEEVEDGDNCE